MKRVLPYALPVAALAVVAFLSFQWFNNRTQRPSELNTLGEGVQIEDLTGADQERIMRGSGDVKRVDLKAVGEGAGQVRYELKDAKLSFTVMAELPELAQGQYQVWLKKAGSDAQKAFVLEYSKGGFVGSGAVSAEFQPFEVVVSKELRPDMTMEEVVLSGQIPA